MKNYQAIPGDIGFVMHWDNPMSKVIAWVLSLGAKDRSVRISHSFGIIGSWLGYHWCAETSDFQMGLNVLDRYEKDPHCSIEIWRHPDILEEDHVQLISQGIGLTGHLYAYLQMISMLVRRLFKLFGIEISNFITLGAGVCCSVPLYMHQNVPSSPLREIDPESIDTMDLRELLISSGFKLVYEKCVG